VLVYVTLLSGVLKVFLCFIVDEYCSLNNLGCLDGFVNKTFYLADTPGKMF
jgi:hypothetical protein